MTTVRELGGRFRQRLQRPPTNDTGVTLAGGDGIPPASLKTPDEVEGENPVAAEGAAGAVRATPTQHGDASRPAAITAWRFSGDATPSLLSLADLAQITVRQSAHAGNMRATAKNSSHIGMPDITTAQPENNGALSAAYADGMEGETAPEIASASRFTWIDVTNYTADELAEVGALLGLHRRAVRIALAPWQRPRLVVYPSHFFVSATVPHLDGAAYQIRAGELDLFIGPSFVVSVHKTAMPFGDHLRDRILNSPELIQLDATFLLYIMLDELVVYYEELNRHVQTEIERLEERALHDSSDTFLEDLVRFKRYTFALSQLADQHRDVFLAFLRPDFLWIAGQEEVEEYFADLYDRLTRLTDTLLDARDAVNGAFEIYVSHLSHRTNQIIRLLTIVSIVLFTASIIVSIFGTTLLTTLHNNLLPTPLGLLLMVAVIVATTGVTLWVFRRRGWI